MTPQFHVHRNATGTVIRDEEGQIVALISKRLPGDVLVRLLEEQGELFGEERNEEQAELFLTN